MDELREEISALIEPIKDKLADKIKFGQVLIEVKDSKITFIRPTIDIKTI